jgi:GTPase SAR1 family protein
VKVLLRGDRNTGKSTLLTVLKGGRFSEAYTPTKEIQTANINWEYKGESLPRPVLKRPLTLSPLL